jgi:uncharacterized 2Fe-2S/4Fe-4S cluster protein (DUF4445 family)
MRKERRITVTFEPGARSVRVDEGSNLLFAAWQSGIAIKSVCGGRGRCGTCLVQFKRSEAVAEGVSEVSKQEAALLPAGPDGHAFRLACMTHVHRDVVVHIPSETEAADAAPRKPYTVSRIVSAPMVSRITLDIKGPYAEPVRPLATRISEAVTGKRRVTIKPAVLADYSRQPAFDTARQITAVMCGGQEIIQLRAGKRSGLYGVALDIGTTSVVLFLCDLDKSEILAVRTASNPQAAYGEDVISRMTHIQRDAEILGKLQSLLVNEINRLIGEATSASGVDTDDILDGVIVGNPTMQHILLGISPEPLGRGPYMSLWSEGCDVEAATIGLRLAAGARLYVFPMASGYIGGDTIAATLTRGREFYRGIHLLIDIGTNGEVVLAKNGKLTATSCATGPVYEGAHIRCGVRASPGAIERIWVESDGTLRWSAIPCHDRHRDTRPMGLCGSGVISGVAALLGAGILRSDGAFTNGHPAVRTEAGTRMHEIVIVPAHVSRTQRDIVITQTDVRNVQLGKAALRAGIETLLREQQIEQVDRIYLAGAFGNHLDPADILSIGMVPPVAVSHIRSIGNAAGDGARMALFNRHHRRRAGRLASELHVIELSNRREFQDTFIECIELSPQPSLEAMAATMA